MSYVTFDPKSGSLASFSGMPNDFRSSGKVTASRSTRDALHVDLRGAAKRARDEAVVEGIRIVHRLAVDRDDQVGGLQAGPRRRAVRSGRNIYGARCSSWMDDHNDPICPNLVKANRF